MHCLARGGPGSALPEARNCPLCTAGRSGVWLALTPESATREAAESAMGRLVIFRPDQPIRGSGAENGSELAGLRVTGVFPKAPIAPIVPG